MAENSPHHGHKWMPVLYATYFGILQEIAHRHGYALAVHGSFTRDMDLIAVPWVDSPSSHEDLLREMYEMIGMDRGSGALPYSSKQVKPHGRTAYTLPTGGGGYVDVSIMRVGVAAGDLPAAPVPAPPESGGGKPKRKVRNRRAS